MAKAIIWVRSSTTKQECESQRAELIKTATSEPYNFKESDLIFIGKVGASAIKLNSVYQKEVDQLLEAIDNEPNLSHLFVWEVSRLARNEKAFYLMKDKILEKKIQLICNVPKIKLLEDNGEVNQGMEITLNLLVTLAKQEMDIKKKRFARGRERKAKEGKFAGGRIPFGYRAYPEKDNFIDTDEKEMEIVKLIYDLYEEGYSQPKIAIELRERGYLNPRYKEARPIQLGQVANILRNMSYTGVQLEEKVLIVKDRDTKKEKESKRYARKYPQIITVEQYNRCLAIAKANRTITGKGKNIYYATKLVKCPSCGCFWSASGSKVDYHCYNAVMPSKQWVINGRTTEQCQNKTSLSINVLDSILWYFAKREEANFILQASEERKAVFKKKIEEKQEKANNIPSEIEKVNAEISKLALRNAEGYISDETFEEKVAIKNRIKGELIDKKLTYQKEIEELEKAIEKIDSSLTNYGVNVKPINGAASWLDVVSERTKQFNELYSTVGEITSDSERYEIIHRVIEWVRVTNESIRYKYKVGWRDTRAKKIVIGTPNWNLDEGKNGLLPKEYTVYYLPFNGKDKGIIIDVNDYISRSANNDNTVVDDDGKVIGHTVQYSWVYDYMKTSEAQFEDEEAPHSVSIIDVPYLNRFTDYGKNKRHEQEKEEAYRPVKDYLRIEDVMSRANVTYGQVYSAIKNGTIKAKVVRHKCFIAPNEAERYIALLNEYKESRGDKLSAFEIAKRLKKDYNYILRRVRDGRIKSESVNGEYLISLDDAENYFSNANEGEKGRKMDGYLSAAKVAKKYGVSYKAVRKSIRQGEIPSTKRNGYYYVSPQDAEDFYGKHSD